MFLITGNIEVAIIKKYCKLFGDHYKTPNQRLFCKIYKNVSNIIII